MPLSFQRKLELDTHYGIMLCRAVDAQGRDLFHYIMADRCGVEQMHRDFKTGKKNVDYAAYGEILYSGWGEAGEDEDEIVRKKWGTN